MCIKSSFTEGPEQEKKPRRDTKMKKKKEREIDKKPKVKMIDYCPFCPSQVQHIKNFLLYKLPLSFFRKMCKKEKIPAQAFGHWSVEQMNLNLFSTVNRHLLNLGEKVVFATII